MPLSIASLVLNSNNIGGSSINSLLSEQRSSRTDCYFPPSPATSQRSTARSNSDASSCADAHGPIYCDRHAITLPSISALLASCPGKFLTHKLRLSRPRLTCKPKNPRRVRVPRWDPWPKATRTIRQQSYLSPPPVRNMHQRQLDPYIPQSRRPQRRICRRSPRQPTLAGRPIALWSVIRAIVATSPSHGRQVCGYTSTHTRGRGRSSAR